MYVRYLGFVLLAWLPEVLHVSAQRAGQPCAPPVLKGGYFIPEQNEYLHEATLIYACDAGRKPVVEGWWATSSCLNGEWSHELQCVDEKACYKPTIPHGKYSKSQDAENDIVIVTCHKGYELKHSSSEARCTNGRWSPLPVCEKRADACDEPPKIPHAVIIYQEPQEVFATDSELQYECRDGYVAESDDTKRINCKSGRWFGSPLCTLQDRSHSQVHEREGTTWTPRLPTQGLRESSSSKPPSLEKQHTAMTPRLPTPAQPCVMHPYHYYQYGVYLPSDLYLHEGQTQYLLTSLDCHIYAHCTNNIVMLGWCCATWDIYNRLCRWTPAE